VYVVSENVWLQNKKIGDLKAEDDLFFSPKKAQKTQNQTIIIHRLRSAAQPQPKGKIEKIFQSVLAAKSHKRRKKEGIFFLCLL